jgi:hypothetical protein
MPGVKNQLIIEFREGCGFASDQAEGKPTFCHSSNTTCDCQVVHLRAQIRTQEEYMKKIISGIPEINNSVIFSTYKLCYRISENATW